MNDPDRSHLRGAAGGPVKLDEFNMWKESQRVAIEVSICPRCKARPGYPCRTRTGNRSALAHAARVDPIWSLASRALQAGVAIGEEWEGFTNAS